MLHRFGEPGLLWCYLLARHANVNVVVILLRKCRRRSRFDSRNHCICGGFVPTSSSRRRGRPVGFALGVLSGTACGMLLLLPLLRGGVTVALAMSAFPRLALLAMGAVPLLVTLLATK